MSWRLTRAAEREHARDDPQPEAADLAFRWHTEKRFNESEAIYRGLLEVNPNDPNVVHYLGVLLHQTGRNDEAIRLIDQSIAINPQSPIYFNNQGLVLIALQRFDDAKAAYTRAAALKPAAIPPITKSRISPASAF